MALPPDYRLVNILTATDCFNILTNLPGPMINDMIKSSPETVLKDLLETNRVFLMDYEKITETYDGT